MVFAGPRLARVDEHAVVSTGDVVEEVAECTEEVVVGGDDGSVELELDDRLGRRDRGGEALVVRVLVLQDELLDDHLPGEHRTRVAAVRAVHRGDEQGQRLGADLDARAVREVAWIGQHPALVRRVLVEDVDGATDMRATGKGKNCDSVSSVAFDVAFMYWIVRSLSQYMTLMGAASSIDRSWASSSLTLSSTRCGLARSNCPLLVSTRRDLS